MTPSKKSLASASRNEFPHDIGNPLIPIVKRSYRAIHLAWLDPSAVRAYNAAQQKAWRAIHRPRKTKRVGA